MESAEHNGTPIDNPIPTDKFKQVGTKARELASSAKHAVEGTPTWVWALLGGIVLLAIGLFAAGQYRARHRH